MSTEPNHMLVNTETHKLINSTKHKGSGMHVKSYIISINYAVYRDMVFTEHSFWDQKLNHYSHILISAKSKQELWGLTDFWQLAYYKYKNDILKGEEGKKPAFYTYSNIIPLLNAK